MITETTEHYTIRAADQPADTVVRVLKQGETFAVLDQRGDVVTAGLGEEGVYHEGTRHLSKLLLTIDGHRPLLLSSIVLQDNSLLVVDLTNPDLIDGDGRVRVPRGMLHICRSCFVWDAALHVRLEMTSYGEEPVHERLHVQVGADFVDIFEVRGTRRARRGALRDPERDGGTLRFVYSGLDGVDRETAVTTEPAPALDDGPSLAFALDLAPHERQVIELRCEFARSPARHGFDRSFSLATVERQRTEGGFCSIESSNEQFNEWMQRSMADLRMMVTETDHGPYPYAGVPWFSTVFGRDGIFTALEVMWMNPGLARGVLGYLAATQAEGHDPARVAEPGKIVHEIRHGEMAALHEIPFGRYYGTIDATPLFVMLAGEYYRRSGDLHFVDLIWPNIERALSWIDDRGDGFVAYAPDDDGLRNQGWKDSEDSIFHASGELAEGSIALCEVQGYAYAARRAAARLADALEQPERAAALRRRADELRQRFNERFWVEKLGTYAIALDGERRPCAVRSSNTGHCLFSRIVPPARAESVARALMAPTSFSGWGVRTIAEGEARYNPMSYHNGSVWPHDTAIVAEGLARYGHRRSVLRILSGLFEASTFLDLHRMPELFCGFPRREHTGPTLYPLACAPQAWAAGACMLLLKSALGLTLDAVEQRVTLRRPALPAWLEEVTIRNLVLGESTIDLVCHRYPNDVGVNVLKCDGPAEVVVVK